MKIPLIWLQDYVETDKSPREIADAFTRIGLMLDKPIGEDQVLDLEQRLNRSDLLSILGCARDFATFEGSKLKLPKVKLHKAHSPTPATKIKITIDTPAVRRFGTRVFRNVQVGPSPEWLQKRLSLYGIDSINNIVDITNFVMIELGQPMHAQDIDKLPAQEITIRPAKAGETLKSLLGTILKLDKKSFVLSSGGIPQVVGGVVGGQNSSVTNNTVNIILDAGNYDPRVVRTSSRQLKIMNETVSRCDKPLHPHQVELALERATDLILELAGGKYYANDDYYPNPLTPQTLTLTRARLQLISGQNITLQQAKSILQALGYSILEEDKHALTVEIPYFRTDVEVEDDLISDILRMRDYNTIPTLSLATPIPPDITPDLYLFEERLRDALVALGGHEHITTQLLQNDGNPSRVVLENALSEEQNALRLSALETLTAVVNNYHKHKITSPLIFEIGKSFIKKDFQEIRECVIIDEQNIRQTLSTLLLSMGISNYELTFSKESQALICVKSEIIGLLEAINCLLYTDKLYNLSKPYPSIISNFIDYSSLDLSISYPTTIKFADISRIVRQVIPTLSSIEVVEEYQTWKLVRIAWPQNTINNHEVREQLVNSLKQIGVLSRSG